MIQVLGWPVEERTAAGIRNLIQNPDKI